MLKCPLSRHRPTVVSDCLGHVLRSPCLSLTPHSLDSSWERTLPISNVKTRHKGFVRFVDDSFKPKVPESTQWRPTILTTPRVTLSVLVTSYTGPPLSVPDNPPLVVVVCGYPHLGPLGTSEDMNPMIPYIESNGK